MNIALEILRAERAEAARKLELEKLEQAKQLKLSTKIRKFERAENGLCVRCAGPSRPGKIMCQACADIDTRKSVMRKKRRRAIRIIEHWRKEQLCQIRIGA